MKYLPRGRPGAPEVRWTCPGTAHLWPRGAVSLGRRRRVGLLCSDAATKSPAHASTLPSCWRFCMRSPSANPSRLCETPSGHHITHITSQSHRIASQRMSHRYRIAHKAWRAALRTAAYQDKRPQFAGTRDGGCCVCGQDDDAMAGAGVGEGRMDGW